MILVFFSVIALGICLPDPGDFNPVPDIDFDDGRVLCDRRFFVREFPVVQMILGAGASVCGSVRDGLDIKSLYFLIRNGLFPFFTVGARTFSMEEMEGLDEFEDLSFLSDSTHMSLGVLGFFEYKKGNLSEDASPAFKPIQDRDQLTAVYMMNKQESALGRYISWKTPRYLKVDIDTGLSTYSFEVEPDFEEWLEGPRFEIQATMVDGPLDEPKDGELSGVRLDPSSLKMSMNVSRMQCKNETSDGFGIAMVMVTRDGAIARGPSLDDPDVDIPDEESETNEVLDIEAEGYSAFMSFKKEVGRLSGEDMIAEDVYINWAEYDVVRELFGTRFIYINDTNMGALRLVGRNIQAMWLSLPNCEMDSFYWDPSLGFSGYLDNGEDGDVFYDASAKVWVSFALMLAILTIFL